MPWDLSDDDAVQPDIGVVFAFVKGEDPGCPKFFQNFMRFHIPILDVNATIYKNYITVKLFM